MKKYIAISFVAAVLLIMSSFSASNATSENDGGDKEISNAEVWEHMHENVFTELNTLVNYDKKRSFSRCPSGFSQYMDEEKSNDIFVYGTISFAQGCDRDEFCLYKIDWEKKDTYLKKTEKDDFLALDAFVKKEKGKVAKI